MGKTSSKAGPSGLASTLALAVIHAYRRYLSPLKGYRCAWGVASGRNTCSGIGLKVVRRAGVLKGLALLGRQFDRCAIASHALAPATPPNTTTPESGTYVRYRVAGLRGQGGFVDCDPGCDADCFSRGPGCDIYDIPKAARGLVPAFLESLLCCDAPCYGDDGKRQERRERRAEKAQSRQASRQDQRDARRRRQAGFDRASEGTDSD